MTERGERASIPKASVVQTIPTATYSLAAMDTTTSTSDKSEYVDFNAKHGCCGALLLLGILVLCTTLPLSFHYVAYDEYALLRDVYGTVRLSKVYEQGRYFYPLNYDTITFPSSYIPVNVDVVVFTDNGLEIEIEIGFYYYLPKENVGKIYDAFSKNYDGLVRTNAVTTIKNVAASLNINDYIDNRAETENKIAVAVNEVLSDVVMVEAPIDLLKIGEISLPESIVDTSLESAIAIQNNELLQSTQEVSVIRAETDRLVAEIDADTAAALQFAQNDAERIVESARSYSNQITLQSRGKGISNLLTALGFQSSSLSSSIIRKLALLDNAENTTVIESGGVAVEYQV